VQGGYVELYGQILNTNNGNIKVLDGYGKVSIQNYLPYQLVLGNVDTGGVDGIVRITDLAKKDQASGAPITTVYQRSGDRVLVQQFAGSTLISETLTDPGRSAVYNPVADQRYVWKRGQEQTE